MSAWFTVLQGRIHLTETFSFYIELKLGTPLLLLA